MSDKIIYSKNVAQDTECLLAKTDYDKLFILSDENTHRSALPLFSDCKFYQSSKEIIIKPDDTNKNIDALTSVWRGLCEGGATRKSIIINIGGGMVTDIGGFAAATFKRGMSHINIPTTLLGAVDAAVGGKTGINFDGLKNEVGAFKHPDSVVISTAFFETLASEHLLSGFAEMIKHGLISNRDSYDKLMEYDIRKPNYETLLLLVKESVSVKERVVSEDPLEKGIRKSLNLGHTIGHAFESIAIERKAPVQHGYAVAWGLVCEAIVSFIKLGFPEREVRRLAWYVKDNYGTFSLTCADYKAIIEKVRHDKKNEGKHINFTLLKDIGKVEINVDTSKEEIEMALDIYRDLFSL